MRENSRNNEEPIQRNTGDNRKFYIVLVCFFIASVFWLLIALSRNYSATISLPVTYSNFPSRKVIVNDLPDKVAVKINTSGFKIIALSLRKSEDVVNIDIAQGLSNSGSLSDALAIPTRYFLQDFARSLGVNIDVTGFAPDSIVFLFKDKVSKKVPVRLDLSFTLEKQFDTVGTPATIPDSILVSGPPSHISKIKEIVTEAIRLKKVNGTMIKPVKLILPSMITSSSEFVKLNLAVEEFTEGVLELPVRVLDVPSGFIIHTYPEKVKLRYQVPLSRYKEIDQQQFDVLAEASVLPSSAITVLPLRLALMPANARNFLLEPSEVEYILRKK